MIGSDLILSFALVALHVGGSATHAPTKKVTMAVRLYKVRGLRWHKPKAKKAFKRWMTRWMRRAAKRSGAAAPKKTPFFGYAD